jgi:GNAT superfamily N-acetyltransferase
MNTQLATIETPVSYGDAELASMAEQIEIKAWQDVVAAAPPWLRMATQLIAEEVDGALLLASRGISNLLFNRVIGLGEQCPATCRQINQIMDRYWTLGIPAYWVHASPYAQPNRLGRILQQHGLKPYRRSWVKMMRPARRVSLAASDVKVRRARVEDAHCIGSIVGPAFDLPQHAAELFTKLIDRRRWTVFVAELNGEVIAAAGLFADGDVAYLAFAATREQFRCRGAQRALMQARINFAHDAGYRWIATETGFPLAADEPSPSYHNMLWAGFRPVAIRDNYAPLGTEWKQLASA